VKNAVNQDIPVKNIVKFFLNVFLVILHPTRITITTAITLAITNHNNKLHLLQQQMFSSQKLKKLLNLMNLMLLRLVKSMMVLLLMEFGQVMEEALLDKEIARMLKVEVKMPSLD